MTISREIQPLPLDEAPIRKALEDAHLPSLLPALAQITGDLSLLRDDLVPETVLLTDPQGGLSAEAQAEARELALRTLVAWRDAGSVVAPPPSMPDVRRMMDYLIGEHVSDEYLPLLLEELAFADKDARAPEWNKDAINAERSMRVLIIGAGMSGILAAHRLQQAGIPYVVIEKNADVGGTWFENTYPGARVDSSNHAYSYSFMQKFDWPYHHSPQEVLLEYFGDCATEFGIRGNIRFNTEVESVTYDEGRAVWAVKVRGPGGDETLEAEAVVSAVGQLNRPKMPNIAGVGAFEGPAFHSAQWDHSIDFAGKTVGVIGTGSSASQFIPHLSDMAGEVRIFQRTPNWYAPAPNYHERVSEGFLWLATHVPTYAQWYRFWLFWAISDGFLPMVEVDDDWQPGDEVTGKLNGELRDLLAGSMRNYLESRPDLIEKTLPDFPPASKRIVVDNGTWPKTLLKEHVHLITEPIERVTPRGVLTEDGEEHELDVLVYGTGFQASKFLTPMKVVGRGGADMHEQWDGDARAYLGITMPNFPNFFFLYGPNTNIVVNGSIVYFSECEVQYVLECLKFLLESGQQAIDCRTDVHDAYNERIDAGNLKRAWGVSSVPSWYKSDSGRVAQNWPFTLLEYWQQTKTMDPADYVLL
ncbi:MAG: NAD(P)/FAD-dependent oxidoreductase [Dehalococcoidia bacterium]|nr:NAD(P)/FAD-dependent oxidoreductase [Dehalococcoidia bacterium]